MSTEAAVDWQVSLNFGVHCEGRTFFSMLREGMGLCTLPIPLLELLELLFSLTMKIRKQFTSCQRLCAIYLAHVLATYSWSDQRADYSYGSG